MAGVVWILGAGFSRSLGGPLLDDLLRPDCLRALWATFPREQYYHLQSTLPAAVVWLYHYGRRFSAGKLKDRVWEDALGERLWRDAEEFLDFVDSAASAEGPARTLINGILHQHRGDLFDNDVPRPEIAEVRGMARRLIAAECSAFLWNTDIGSERWGPYMRWARELVQPGDTVVTFNYDLVLEHLCRETKRMAVVVPEAPAMSDVWVLKLHGSVNWKRTEAGRFAAQAQEQEATFCCTCRPSELTIATPGRTKAEHAKELQELWGHATHFISQAEAVVFLGYRFPPSDAEARVRLLGALAKNTRRYLPVHTVLGPDVQSVDSARLQGLLHHTLRSRKPYSRYPLRYADPNRDSSESLSDLVQQPLFVEDFLSVVERAAVIAPLTGN